MRLREFVRDSGLEARMDEALWTHVERTLDRAARSSASTPSDTKTGLEILLADAALTERVPPERLLALTEAHRELRRLERLGTEAGLSAVHAARVRDEHEIAALRALAPVAGVDLLELYRRAFAIAWRDAVAHISGHDEAGNTKARDEEGRLRAVELGGVFRVEELVGSRWLATRRARAEGVVDVELELELEPVREQVALLLGDGGARDVSAEAVEAVLDPLARQVREGIFAHLFELSQREAFDQAVRSYRGLIETPPLDAQRVIAVHVPRRGGALGAVRIDEHGRVSGQKIIDRFSGDTRELRAWLSRYDADGYVLPARAPDARLLKAVREALPQVAAAVGSSGLSEGRDALGPEFSRLPAPVQFALVHAHRALRPFETWSLVDPGCLGLAEYGRDLDEARLAARLADVRALVAHLRKNTDRTLDNLRNVVVGSGRLNPMIGGLPDLRPGMMLDAQVTSIATFGAFVHFGLETEGLIHISELSEQRVQSPSEVVRIGQRLRARVLEVDVDRGHVKLSLRPERPRAAGSGSRSKADALSRLNKMFGGD